ncbi:hypothetical protein BFW38_01345 [Terasakiispira papahanaumokuakeensis]|uniref:HTH tetR-type domain-containing protein n=1 Tax=Terasakiispira papahanaumokuakeensis TaxID=197479 RepID=A0A1E2VEK9_9GAMM|nr:hypothetical protein BFW38_01345 [Terasakiispira papahanaumokuakeensis]
MSEGSPSSRDADHKVAQKPRQPKRLRGKQRVEDLLKAATSIFAAKGYDAATMTEIAARAKAPIGSLYQFFPNKEVLAGALMQRYAEHLEAQLTQLSIQAGELSTDTLLQHLLGVMQALALERQAVMTLIEARNVTGESRHILRQTLRRGIQQVLCAHCDTLASDDAEVLTVMLVQAMKAMVLLGDESCAEAGRKAWLEMVQMYFQQRLPSAGEM